MTDYFGFRPLIIEIMLLHNVLHNEIHACGQLYVISLQFLRRWDDWLMTVIQRERLRYTIVKLHLENIVWNFKESEFGKSIVNVKLLYKCSKLHF